MRRPSTAASLLAAAALAVLPPHALASRGCDELRQTTFVLHNDAVGRGLHEEPFIGFSLEVPHASLYVRNPAFRALMRHLRDATGLGRGPRIRVGGFTQDSTAYVGRFSAPGTTHAAVEAIPGIRGIITDGDVSDLALAADFNGTLTVGLNFVSAAHPEPAVAHLAALRALLPRGLLAGIEVGNEPDRFAAPRVQFRRSGGWGYGVYKAELAARLAALQASLPRGEALPPLSGPAWTQDNPPFLSHVGDFARTFGSPDGGGGAGVLGEVNVHYYPLLGCAGQHYRLRALLRSGRPHFADHLMAAARAGGVRAVIGEGNSVTCGGRAGLSDTFAAALWAVETWLDLIRVGIARFNAHGGPAYPYTPIAMEPEGVVTASPAPTPVHAPAAGAGGDPGGAGRRRALRPAGATASNTAAATASNTTGSSGGGRALWDEAGGVFALTTSERGRKRTRGQGGAAGGQQQHHSHHAARAHTRWVVRARPLYYAALVVAAATGGGAAPVSFDRFCCGHGYTCGRQTWIRPFAYRAPSGDMRLVIVNRLLPGVDAGAGAPHRLQVTAPPEGLLRSDGTHAPVARALWYVLSAPSPTAMYNVTWAGLSFDGSADGEPTAPSAPVEVVGGPGGVFFPPDLPSGSVGMLVLEAAPRHPDGGGAHSHHRSAQAASAPAGAGRR